MPRKPHPDRSAALALLREGRTPREVLAALPRVRSAALYKWMAAEGIPAPAVRVRDLTPKAHEILSAILYLEHVARQEGEDVPTDPEIGAAWGLSKQRIGALRGEISDGE